MRVLVTGASGFLGKQFIRRLAQGGDEVVALCRQRVDEEFEGSEKIQWYCLDLARDSLPDFPRIDVVVHLAGTGWSRGLRLDQSNDELLLLCSNEQTTVALLSRLAPKVNRFVFASSQVVYGSPNSVKVTEEFSIDAERSAYACSKVNNENWMRWFQKRYGGQYISLRFSGFIDGGGMVDYLIDRAMLNEPIELYSMGRIYRDYMPSAKGVDALFLATKIRSDPGYIPLNVGSGQPVSAHDLAAIVCNELDSSSPIKLLEFPSPQSDFVFSIEKAKSFLGFDPGNLVEAVRSHARRRKRLARLKVRDAEN